MAALWIVEPFDVLEDIGSRFIARAIARFRVDPLLLEAREEALHRRIVPAVALAAHATGDSVMGEQSLEVFRRVLASLIRVMHQLLWPAAAPQGHGEGVHDELCGHLRA